MRVFSRWFGRKNEAPAPSILRSTSKRTRELIEISDTVRVESGPVRRRAIASHDTLSDGVTARHYKAGRFDAEGKVILLGQEMTYLDYRGDWAYHIYQKRDTMLDGRGAPTTDKAKAVLLPSGEPYTESRYIEVGVERDLDKAIRIAEAL